MKREKLLLWSAVLGGLVAGLVQVLGIVPRLRRKNSLRRAGLVVDIKFRNSGRIDNLGPRRTGYPAAHRKPPLSPQTGTRLSPGSAQDGVRKNSTPDRRRPEEHPGKSCLSSPLRHFQTCCREPKADFSISAAAVVAAGASSRMRPITAVSRFAAVVVVAMPAVAAQDSCLFVREDFPKLRKPRRPDC